MPLDKLLEDDYNINADEPILNVGTKYKTWRVGNKLHVIDIQDGYEAWYQNDLLHREDGPAQVYASGMQLWALHGKYLSVNSQEEFERYMKLKGFW
jgi:hypothetical protein